jgi:hypothetical protein
VTLFCCNPEVWLSVMLNKPSSRNKSFPQLH